MAITTKGELLNVIQSRVRAALENDVVPLVIEKLKQHSQSDIYDSFTSKEERRFSFNSDSSYDYEMKDWNSVFIFGSADANRSLMGAAYSYTPDNPTRFSSWINDGDWMDIAEFNKTGNKVKREKRPFVDNAREEIRMNPEEIKRILMKTIYGK